MSEQDDKKRKLKRIRSVAHRLDVSEKTVRRLIDERKLETTKVRGSLRVFEDSLEIYIESQKI